MAKKLYSPEEASKRFEALPQEIKDLLYSFEMTSIITKVGEKHGLHLDQMGSLNTEVSYVMLGLTTTEEFPSILMEDLGVDQQKASAIVKDVSEMLFAKIREAMQKPASLATEPEAPANPPAVTAAPAPATAVPAKAAEIHPADLMLTQKTVVAPPATAQPAAGAAAPASPAPVQKTEPPKPEDYKADPYREPTI